MPLKYWVGDRVYCPAGTRELVVIVLDATDKVYKVRDSRGVRDSYDIAEFEAKTRLKAPGRYTASMIRATEADA